MGQVDRWQGIFSMKARTKVYSQNLNILEGVPTPAFSSSKRVIDYR